MLHVFLMWRLMCLSGSNTCVTLLGQNPDRFLIMIQHLAVVISHGGMEIMPIFFSQFSARVSLCASLGRSHVAVGQITSDLLL